MKMMAITLAVHRRRDSHKGFFPFFVSMTTWFGLQFTNLFELQFKLAISFFEVLDGKDNLRLDDFRFTIEFFN
jgi:hypothetical protein